MYHFHDATDVIPVLRIKVQTSTFTEDIFPLSLLYEHGKGTSLYAHIVYMHIDLILKNPYTFSGLVFSMHCILTVGKKSNLVLLVLGS